jgi:hypothetical protein
VALPVEETSPDGVNVPERAPESDAVGDTVSDAGETVSDAGEGSGSGTGFELFCLMIQKILPSMIVNEMTTVHMIRGIFTVL